MASGQLGSTFHWADYLLFGASVAGSLGIGVYFACVAHRERAADTSAVFMLAGRNAQVFPVAMSMLASFLSAIFVIGVPAEVAQNGSMFVVCGIGYVVGPLVGARCYLPALHAARVTSVYQYLETRFNKVVRILASCTFIVMMILYMSVVMYAPAISFSTVTGLSTWLTVFGIGLVCTAYTALGGMRAVIWTDTFQMAIIFLGLVVLVARGCSSAGGPGRVWTTSVTGGRLDFTSLSPDPRVRHTWWTQSVGVSVNMLSLIAGNQIVIQRYLSINKVKDAQLSIYLALGGALVILLLCELLGLVIYTYYSCDPVTQGHRAEEVVPMFMMQVLGDLPGLPGLFTASVFAASLSTVSSVVQALAAVSTEDIIRDIFEHCTGRPMSDTVTTRIAKTLALVFGLMTIGLSYLAPYLGPFLIQISLSILGTAGGPLLGLFTLAIFFPCTNSWGAGSGLITSIIVTYWINIGAIVTNVSPTPLPARTENCTSRHGHRNVTAVMGPSSGVAGLYEISYMWYGVVSVCITVITGLVVSAATGFRRDALALEGDQGSSYADRCCGGCVSDCRHSVPAEGATIEKTPPGFDDEKVLTDWPAQGEVKVTGVDHLGFTMTRL